ncbi:MAG: putative MAPEG superfamily protein [Paracoccaceae bacterium]|jgi:uncharacterized MAPEG superfamily protein
MITTGDAMSEIHILALSGLLTCVQFALMAIPANQQLGPEWTMGARDVPREMTGVAGRLHRAFNNQLEGLLLFAVAAVCVTLLDASTPFTRGAAVVYIVARVVYIPLYALGVPLWRSLIWAAGFVATAAMLIAALL